MARTACEFSASTRIRRVLHVLNAAEIKSLNDMKDFEKLLLKLPIGTFPDNHSLFRLESPLYFQSDDHGMSTCSGFFD